MVLSVEEAQPRLRELLEKAAHGESVVITMQSGVRLSVSREAGDKPVIASESTHVMPEGRVFGAWEGQFKVGPEFFEPMSDDWLKEFYEGPVFPPDEKMDHE